MKLKKAIEIIDCKRYLLFASDYYYPIGGAEDLVGSYDTIEEAIKALDFRKYDEANLANILDLNTLSIVKYGLRGVWSNEDLR
jgi:hypothetical protein